MWTADGYSGRVKVYAVQFDIAWEDKAANYATVRRLIADAAPEGGSLVVLPEMFATGFSMNADEIAEPYEGETEQFLASLAREQGVWLLGGVAMKDQSGSPRNKALVFSPEGKLGAYYKKMRLFSPSGEGNHYVAGERAVSFRWEECSVSPFICYDLRFPEIFREAVRAARPELFCVIANWPAKRVLHWVRLLQARAIENQAYVVGVNRVGRDPYYEYAGRSIIVDPHGEILADAEEREAVISAPLDLATLRKYREGLAFLGDMQ